MLPSSGSVNSCFGTKSFSIIQKRFGKDNKTIPDTNKLLVKDYNEKGKIISTSETNIDVFPDGYWDMNKIDLRIEK